MIIALLMAVVGVVALPTTASAQFDLSKLGGLFGGSSSKTTKSPYATLAENAPAKSQVLGVWKYNSVSVEYLGTSAFADASVSQLNTFANTELKEAGIVPGCFTIKLQSNGKGSLSYEDMVYEGSYTYDSAKARFVLTVVTDDGKTLSCNGFLKIVNGKLGMMIKAEDALNAVSVAAPELRADSTFLMIQGVVDSFSGIYLTLYCGR
jgi:hypothetical protein